jgi:hypothetical protein
VACADMTLGVLTRPNVAMQSASRVLFILLTFQMMAVYLRTLSLAHAIFAVFGKSTPRVLRPAGSR